MVICLDNGHGVNCKGKCSPDGRFREYRWSREIARMIADIMQAEGYDCRLIVKEEEDIPLSVRAKRVNEIVNKEGSNNVILVSIHNDAAGSDGRWHDARGWSVFVYDKASKESQRLALCLYEKAMMCGLKGNRATAPEKFKRANFAILRETNCPAVLTENLFQDNEADVEYLESVEGKMEIVWMLIDGILKYIKGE